jgi:Ca2+-binding EF-hand superfamily protein
LQEFVGLWGYLDQWRNLFRRFDADGSGAIDRGEFSNALQSFGYRLSDKFVNLLFASYDKRGETPELQLGEEPAGLSRQANVV